MLDAEGHIKVTDFGLAKVMQEGARHNSLVGTVDYMAPEIVAGRGHGMSADWWSVGVLLYEMLTGGPPFKAKNRALLQKKIVSEKIKYPPFLSTPAHRLLGALLQREEPRRLGSGPGGAAAIQAHEFFKGLSWARLLERGIPAPFRPSVADERCTANFDEMWTKMPANDSPTVDPRMTESDPFVGYTYSRESHLDTVGAQVMQSRSERDLAAAAAEEEEEEEEEGGGAGEREVGEGPVEGAVEEGGEAGAGVGLEEGGAGGEGEPPPRPPSSAGEERGGAAPHACGGDSAGPDAQGALPRTLNPKAKAWVPPPPRLLVQGD